MRTVNKKIAAVAAGAIVVASAGAAYAYWTTSGSGSGSAATGTSTPVSIAQVSDLSGYVLGAVKDVNVTVTNPASFSQNVGNVTVSVADAGSCLSSNWLVTDVADNLGTIAASTTSASTKVATLQLKDLATNQDACKSVTPILTYAAAAGS